MSTIEACLPLFPSSAARRERRLAKQRTSSNRTRGALLTVGWYFRILLAAFILLGAFAYADVTRDLPSVEILPRLLNPPDGLLLQPTRIYDRTGVAGAFYFCADRHSRAVTFPSTNKTHSIFPPI